MSGGFESRELEAQLQDSVGVGDGQRVIAGAKYVSSPPRRPPGTERGFGNDLWGLVGLVLWRVSIQLLTGLSRDDAVETDIANLYKTDRAAFEKTAKQWVKSYAKEK